MPDKRRPTARKSAAPLAADLRQRILNTSELLLEENGVAALSMREVARRAGVTHQAPYHHFADRESILAELVAQGFDELSRRLARAAKLAGALNGIAFERMVDSGFVVAGLKRALNFLHQSMDATDRVRRRNILDAEALEEFRREVFDVRQAVLDLMKRIGELIAEG